MTRLVKKARRELNGSGVPETIEKVSTEEVVSGVRYFREVKL